MYVLIQDNIIIQYIVHCLTFILYNLKNYDIYDTIENVYDGFIYTDTATYQFIYYFVVYWAGQEFGYHFSNY